jgi:5-formyltetrahydrofolate cyclo-ligase
MTKSYLRKKYKALRNGLSKELIDDRSIDIANNLLKLNIWHYGFYHIFLPIERHNEVNTEFILNILSGKDKNIVISQSNFATLEMTHYLLTDNTMIRKNDFDIPEPIDGIEIPSSKLDVVFVPLLTYDQLGNRVGYGKGFYDRFLSECRDDVIKIGLSFFEAEALITDIDLNDVRLDYCVTDSEVLEF